MSALEPDSPLESGIRRLAVPRERAESVRLAEGLSGPCPMSADTEALPRFLRALPIGEAFDARYRHEGPLSLGRGVARVQVRDQWTGYSTSLSLIDLRAFRDVGAAELAAQEARAVATVKHPNVVPVGHAALSTALGVYYQEVDPGFEYADGQRLRALSASDCRPRSTEEAVRFARDAARGLAAAHRQGVFHLAMTPAALRVRPVTRRVQVEGFGCLATLARVRIQRAGRGGPEGHAHPGHDGHTHRTPYAKPGDHTHASREPPVAEVSYLAPELVDCLADSRLPADLQRVDVYGLSAVLHELLTGAPPLGQCDSLADQWARLSAHARVGRATVVRRRLRRGQGFRVPARLWRVLECALSVDPERRYPSCAALADDLDLFLAARPTSREGGRAGYWAQAFGLWWRRTRSERAFVAQVLALLALLSAAAFGVAEAREAHRALELKRLEIQALGPAASVPAMDSVGP